jgi:hypothetical protein
MRLFTSARLCVAVCSLCFASAAFAQSTSPYTDPHDHFTLQVQPGRFAKPFDGIGTSGVTIAHAAANFTLAQGRTHSLRVATAFRLTPSPANPGDPKPDPNAQPEPASDAWTKHTDPAGFVVDLPASWTVGKDPATGRIILRGTRREQVVIWPLFLQQVQLDARGVRALLHQLAHNVDAQLPWGAVQPMQNVERVIASSGQRSGAAMLSWAKGPSGTSVYLYCVEAPTDVYRTSTDAFVGILKSFHIVQDPSLKNLSGPRPGAGALSFVNWNDPYEGAFSVAVPEGWRVIGGTYRLSATDVRYAIAMGSPDGQVRTRIGDSSIGLFIPRRRCSPWPGFAKVAITVWATAPGLRSAAISRGRSLRAFMPRISWRASAVGCRCSPTMFARIWLPASLNPPGMKAWAAGLISPPAMCLSPAI